MKTVVYILIVPHGNIALITVAFQNDSLDLVKKAMTNDIVNFAPSPGMKLTTCDTAPA